MRLEDTTKITDKCFHGEPASCTHGCPFRLDIRAFIARTRDAQWNRAYKQLQSSLVFPHIVAELCPGGCASMCQRTDALGGAVDVRAIERACVRYAERKTPEKYRLPDRDGRIAVVGAGLAGLSCALSLAQKKYAVTVFERCGAVLPSLAGHPLAADFLADIDLQFSVVDHEVRLDSKVGSLDELSDFDVVYVATGAGGDDFGLIGSWNADDMSAERPGVFLGGELCGMSPMQSVASGAATSKYIEAWLQNGTTLTGEKDPSLAEAHMLDHTDEAAVPRIEPEAPDGVYAPHEAVEESLRCMLCDCRLCMDACEMLGSFKKRPQKIAIEAYTDTMANPPYSSCNLTRETYSCNMCGKCRSVCPVDIDIGKVLRIGRRGRIESGNQPSAFHGFWMGDFAFATGEGSYYCGGRDYLFFPGCKLGESDPRHVARTAAFLKERFGAGTLLDCCGAPAYWAGEDEALAAHTERLRKIWSDAGEPVFVYACAYCARVLEEFLPEIRLVSVYELMSGADVQPQDHSGALSVFDPCAAAGRDGMRKAVRALAAASGADAAELPQDSDAGCCGFGGHMRTANPGLYDEIMEHRKSLSDNAYLVYCANCAEAFRADGKDCVHILDIVFGLPRRGAPVDLQEKRDNHIAAADGLAALYGTEMPTRQPPPWSGVRIDLPPAILSKMNDSLILADDVREAILAAESTGCCFFDPEEGSYLCSLVRQYITYWVKYRKDEDGSCAVMSVYSHRMHFQAASKGAP
jgi:Fe-S oxidoreductase